MAFVNGKHEGSSVTRALSRAKLRGAADSVNSEGGHNPGDGDEITVKKMPGGGYHTSSKRHDGTTSEADHQNIEQVTEHMHSHFGHAKPTREKNPKMREKEPEAEPDDSMPMPNEGGLEAMGVDTGA